MEMTELLEIASEPEVDTLIERAFEEDIQKGDVTTNAIVDPDAVSEARWIARGKGIIAGLSIAKKVFQKLDPEIVWKPNVSDGNKVAEDFVIVEMNGKTRGLLTAERIALNIVQRLSGIATETKKYTDLLKDHKAKIMDTRKTVPGFRVLDKYAVKVGGGVNHRMGLFDMALIKDNHILAAGSITAAVERVRQARPDLKIEVEIKNIEEIKEALAADADIIMLDNMSPQQMTRAVNLIDGRATTEASGNITRKNVREVAASGVDFISVGALTHSVKAFDISQQIVTG